MASIENTIGLHRLWQTNWREILGEPTIDMPEDIGSDSALHFDIWELEAAKQQECFSMFPNGIKMLERANLLRTIVPEKKDVDDAKLLGHLDSINQELETVLAKSRVQSAIEWNEGKNRCSKSVVYRGDFEWGEERLGNAIPPTDPLSTILRELLEKQFGDEGYALYGFLFEPLYRVANDNGVMESIFWEALRDEYGANPYYSVVELYKTEAQAGWDEVDDEMFVYMET